MPHKTSTILLSLSGKEVAATETNTLTVEGVEIAGGAGDLTHASGSLLWNRDESLSGQMDSQDLGLSDELALVSGQGGWDHASGTWLWNRDDSLSGQMDAQDLELSNNVATLSGQNLSLESGAYLQYRANHTGTQLSEFILQALDIWTGIETISSSYNDRLVTLNSPTGTFIKLPSGLDVGFNISFWNGNTGTWVFSGSPNLYNLDDDLLYNQTLKYKDFSSFLFKGIETGWYVFAGGGRHSLDKTLDPPTAIYDIDSGFDVGSVVIDSLSGFNVCLNADDNAAKWSKLNEEAIPFSLSAENENLATGLDVLKFRIPYDFYLTDIRAGLSSYATGAPIVINFYDDDISILSGSMVIDTGIYTSLDMTTGITISGAVIIDDSEISIDVVGVGLDLAPGTGLKLWFKGIRI